MVEVHNLLHDASDRDVKGLEKRYPQRAEFV